MAKLSSINKDHSYELLNKFNFPFLEQRIN